MNPVVSSFPTQLSEGPTRSDPHRRLAAAVLGQAVRDVKSKGPRGETARGLLFSTDEDYRTLRRHWLEIYQPDMVDEFEEILAAKGPEGVAGTPLACRDMRRRT